MCSKIELHPYTPAFKNSCSGFSTKTQLLAILAFGSLAAWYDPRLFCFGLGSYALYRFLNTPSKSELKKSKYLETLPYHPSDLKLSKPKKAADKLSKELDRAKQQMEMQEAHGVARRQF